MYNIKRRGIAVVNRCCMCHEVEEFVNHLFLHCEKAYVFFCLGVLTWFMAGTSMDTVAA